MHSRLPSTETDCGSLPPMEMKSEKSGSVRNSISENSRHMRGSGCIGLGGVIGHTEAVLGFEGGEFLAAGRHIDNAPRSPSRIRWPDARKNAEPARPSGHRGLLLCPVSVAGMLVGAIGGTRGIDWGRCSAQSWNKFWGQSREAIWRARTRPQSYRFAERPQSHKHLRQSGHRWRAGRPPV